MKISWFAILAVVMICNAGGAWAGDADAGAKLFTRCKACHSVVAQDGTIVVRGGKVCPNLFGVMGRPLASV
ncbi:MAG TPA: cytochrome C, partial [Paenirhodobacter sp.]